MNTQIACSKCRSTVTLSVNGNTIETPLTCSNCGQTFSPHFYCPDATVPTCHIFAADTLYVDNLGSLYAFCPEHSYTTYALAADSRLRVKRTLLRSAVHFLSSLIFRFALGIESLRWRFASRGTSQDR